MKKHYILLLLTLAISASLSAQQAGVLDTTFNHTGLLSLSVIPQGSSFAADVCLQPDGKIIIAGGARVPGSLNSDFAIVRLNNNGSIDSSFGNNGIVLTDFFGGADAVSAIKLLPDGKIIVAGSAYKDSINKADIAVVRYTPTGETDNSFGQNGKVLTDLNQTKDEASELIIQSDGKIIIAGNAISKNPNNTNNYVGYILRYSENGEADISFNGNGKKAIELDVNTTRETYISDIISLSSGSIIACGFGQDTTPHPDEQNHGMLVKLNSNGDIDASFGESGFVLENYFSYSTFSSLAITGGLRISVLCGSYIKRYKINGTPDLDFGNNAMHQVSGSYYSEYTGFLVQPDGKYVVYGSILPSQFTDNADWILARVNSNGYMDINQGWGNIYGWTSTNFSNNNDWLYKCALQPDLKILAVGTSGSNIAVARYLTGLDVGLLEFSQTETAPLLYPNPLQQTETLKYTLTEAEQISIVLIDSQGKLVDTFLENENQAKGEHEIKLTLPSTLSPGTYFIQIASPKGKFSIKAVK